MDRKTRWIASGALALAVVGIEGASKAPDYSFRIGGTRKFFVDAKEPGVNIKDNPRPAYQLRRYAWSAKLPTAVTASLASDIAHPFCPRWARCRETGRNYVVKPDTAGGADPYGGPRKAREEF